MTPVKQSQASSNLYFDVKVQTANQESKIVKVMHQKGDGCKRHIFVDKMNAQQPVKISNLSVTASGTMFFNKGAGIQDLPSHTITFQYEVQDPFEVTMVNSLMKSTTGNFNVGGSRVSRKLRPRKLRPQTLKTQTLWVSRKLRP